jgi:hypothetical protein
MHGRDEGTSQNAFTADTKTSRKLHGSFSSPESNGSSEFSRNRMNAYLNVFKSKQCLNVGSRFGWLLSYRRLCSSENMLTVMTEHGQVGAYPRQKSAAWANPRQDSATIWMQIPCENTEPGKIMHAGLRSSKQRDGNQEFTKWATKPAGNCLLTRQDYTQIDTCRFGHNFAAPAMISLTPRQYC